MLEKQIRKLEIQKESKNVHIFTSFTNYNNIPTITGVDASGLAAANEIAVTFSNVDVYSNLYNILPHMRWEFIEP